MLQFTRISEPVFTFSLFREDSILSHVIDRRRESNQQIRVISNAVVFGIANPVIRFSAYWVYVSGRLIMPILRRILKCHSVRIQLFNSFPNIIHEHPVSKTTTRCIFRRSGKSQPETMKITSRICNISNMIFRKGNMVSAISIILFLTGIKTG